jgi:hypothetical protein
MLRRGQLRPIDTLSQIYEVTVPYASTSPVSEWEILMELNPYSAVSHGSALAFHGMSDLLLRRFILTTSMVRPNGLWPVGTTSDDWHGITLPPNRHPKTIHGQAITWKRIRPGQFTGIAEYHYLEYPVRVTTPERTLVDCVQEPGHAGGIDSVLEAWANQRDTLDVEGVVAVVEQMNNNVLRQRIGFILTRLGLNHPRLIDWRKGANRGGSSKLVASEPYSPEYSEEWSISLNARVELLDGPA